MVASPLPRLLPPMSPALKLAMLGCFVGFLIYVPYFFQPTPPKELEKESGGFAVPVLDQALLAQAKDSTREERLILEVEPLRHLLAKAIDVVPTVAAAFNTPEVPVPLTELRAQRDKWRGQWLSYKGVLEELNGPRQGNPVAGYSIYEATVKLPSGDRVLADFSIPPGDKIHRGDVVRVEGYLLKLRDTTYPNDLREVPQLIGRQIQNDYLDWGPVTKFDPELLANLDESCFPGTLAWRTVDEDQAVPLWHIAAFARDTTNQRTFAEWRRIGTLNEPEVHPALSANQLARGTPMRVLGTLVKRHVIAADPNPAGIKYWTSAYVQVRDFGGMLIPIWVPKRVDTKLWSDVEVRAFYYRWFAYDAQNGTRFRVPLFVAADLDPYDLDPDPTHAMRKVGITIGAIATTMIALFWWAQRKAARQSLQHDREMDMRRRRRREKSGMAQAEPPASAP